MSKETNAYFCDHCVITIKISEQDYGVKPAAPTCHICGSQLRRVKLDGRTKIDHHMTWVKPKEVPKPGYNLMVPASTPGRKITKKQLQKHVDGGGLIAVPA